MSPGRRLQRYEPVDEGTIPDVAVILGGVEHDERLVAAAAQTGRVVVEQFDTQDRRLRAAGAAISRVEGGDDEGWHADLTGRGSGERPLRRSSSLARGRRTVPVGLRRLMWTFAGDSPLVPVARVTTDRTVHPLQSQDGETLAVIATEQVEVERIDAGEPTRLAGWVELRLESPESDRKVFRALDERLRSLNLQRSAERPEVDHLLGTGRRVAGPRRPATSFGPKSAVGEVVGAYVARQVHVVVATDPLVRLDVPASIHHMRVATRRLRGCLKTYRSLYDVEALADLPAELRWLAAELGAARDAEVLQHRLLAGHGDEPTFARPLRLAAGQLGRDYRAAHRNLLDALESDRYHALVDGLRMLAAKPQGTKTAAKRADRTGARKVAKADRRLHRTMTAGVGLPAGVERNRALHDARKAAKQARYAAEAVAPALGKPARSFADAMKQLQKKLGARQDAVVAQGRLLELASNQRWDLAFLCGQLHAREVRRAAAVDEALDKIWRAASDEGIRAWLRA